MSQQRLPTPEPMLPKSLKNSLAAVSFSVWAAAAQPLRAQSLEAISPGARVQITITDSLRQEPILAARQRIIGSLIRATSDSIWLQPMGSGPLAVSRTAVRGTSASLGISRARSAVSVGVQAGLLALASQLARDRNDISIGVIGAGVGLGFSLGAIFPFEHWRRIKP